MKKNTLYYTYCFKVTTLRSPPLSLSPLRAVKSHGRWMVWACGRISTLAIGIKPLWHGKTFSGSNHMQLAYCLQSLFCGGDKLMYSTESFKVFQKGWPCLFCYTSQIWNQVLNIQGHQLWGLICVILSNCWFAVEADVGIKWVLCGLGLRVGKKVPSSAAKPGLDSKSSYWCWKNTLA